VKKMTEHCALCGCLVHREGEYAKPTVKGRSHRTKHHHVAERFFGRSSNRPGTLRERIFPVDPWGFEGKSEIFCYDCHEELLHNPILLPEDIKKLAEFSSSKRAQRGREKREQRKACGAYKAVSRNRCTRTRLYSR